MLENYPNNKRNLYRSEVYIVGNVFKNKQDQRQYQILTDPNEALFYPEQSNENECLLVPADKILKIRNDI